MKASLQPIFSLIRCLLKKLDLVVIRQTTLDSLQSQINIAHDFQMIQSFSRDEYVTLLPKSKAQLRQDLFVLHQLNFKTHGFFVEFGATNGVSLSNTYLLESEFEWLGIVAEPARVWHEELKQNRNCFIKTSCVWSDSTSTLRFKETESPELSTIDQFKTRDGHKNSRIHGIEYDVKTISLADLLNKYNAPFLVDYLSIDTEGSELEILKAFNFSKYKFRVITCEHNFTQQREKFTRY